MAASSPLVDLLGPTLKGKDGDVSTADALSGKTAVGVYFSAHWCGPCRGFTPKLADAYTKDLKAKGLEVVFVSSDRDESSFDDYYKEMPWLALPFAARDLKASLSKKYKVRGIPSFVILDGTTGEVITKDGRSAMSADPSGKKFPWRPPTFWEALGSEFLHGTEGETVDVEELKGEGKVIGLYFSAHWCPPCRGFTPKLIEAYDAHLKAKGLEIIFVSSDRDQASFADYYKDMPWLAIPQGDKRKEALDAMFEVQGIPTLVLVDGATGKVINADSRSKVDADPTGAEFPWHPKALNDLSKDGPDGINDSLCLVVLAEGCDEGTTSGVASVLGPIAEESKKGGAETLFFYASEKGEIPQKVRSLCKLSDVKATPQMLLLDIPDDGGYYVSPATEVTADTVNAFLEGYKAKSLERMQLG